MEQDCEKGEDETHCKAAWPAEFLQHFVCVARIFRISGISCVLASAPPAQWELRGVSGWPTLPVPTRSSPESESVSQMETLELTWVEVTFHNVASSYIPGVAVECRYTLVSPSHWNCRDWIGLFKMGWISLNDYYTFLWSPSPQQDQGELTASSICFEANQLPAETPTLYQFCYIDAQGTCLGSSSPFTFCQPSTSNQLLLLNSLDRNIDLVRVMNRMSQLEVQLAESEIARVQLAELHQQLCYDVHLLKMQLQELEVARLCAHEVHEDLKREYETLQEEKAKATADCLQLKMEQEETESKLLDLEADVRTLRETMQERVVALDRAQESIRELEDERGEWIEIIKGNAEAQSTLQDKNEEVREKICTAENKVWAHWKIDREIQKQLLEVEKKKAVNLQLELHNCQVSAQEKETELVRAQEERNVSQVQLLDVFNKNWELKCELQVTQKERDILRKENKELLDRIRFLEEKLRRETEVRVNMETNLDQLDPSDTLLPRSMETDPPTASQTWSDMDLFVTEPDSKGSHIPEDVSLELDQVERQDPEESATSSQAMTAEAMETTTETDISAETTITKVDLMNALDIPTRDGNYVCPICTQQFSMMYKKELMIQHIDSHFFVGASDPFVFQ
ncbi:calcium-binding and coiled-coil domain-containing protein 1-A-like isoform X2 [Mobula birostris]|uniref:calcium-binding and coiled-coil domain-containing protein 1-A-like isoform X2 n=1 Tax=Mobula birostris TaxID=1983395 RepID=UPI003B27CE18